MKTFLEVLSEAAGNQPLPITEYIKLLNNEKLTRLLNKAGDIYAELSNSHKPVVVRGGAIKAQSVPLEGEALKWTNSCVTQITPTEPLATEALDTVAVRLVELCGSDCCPDDGRCEHCQNPITAERKSSEGQQ